jgi:FKBP-type peptidyl-prolyl cis-trans isomerase SlyD
MIIEKGKVVEMHYRLKNEAGDLIDTSEKKEPMPFLQGYGNIIPGLERALEGKKAGDELSVSVEPKDAYGELKPEAIQEIPMNALAGIEDLKVGMELQSEDEQGNTFIVRVEKIEADSVMINANHPLAGQALHFEVKIESVRAATAEELTHEHVHSTGCSH